MGEIARSVEREFRTLDLGDARRVHRAKQMATSFLSAPEASIPVACRSSADSKAAYRFLGSEVSAEALRAAQYDATVERMGERKVVLALHDKTNLDFTCCPGTEGLGPLDAPLCRGLKVQTVLLTDVNGVPLGVIDQQVWARDEELGKKKTRRARAPEEKESWHWRTGFEAADARVPEGVRIIGIGDREADIFFVLAMPRSERMDLLIRAAHNRAIQNEEYQRLREAVEAAPVAGRYELTLGRTRKRGERVAKLEVRIAQVVLKPPRNGTNGKGLAPVSVSAVWVREQGEVPKGEKPVDWLLLATWPVEDLEAALECVRMYAHRWKIERYHYVLKSGCRIEDLQLETADRLNRALALYSFVAWRLLWLTYQARQRGGIPCSEALEDDEWKVLLVVSGVRKARNPPSLEEAIRLIATFGGFQGRKGDGAPGVKAIWQGWRRLMDFVLAARALANG